MNRRGKSLSGRVQTGVIKKKPRQDHMKALLPMKNLCFSLSARALLLAGAAAVASPAFAADADMLSDASTVAPDDSSLDTGTSVPDTDYDVEEECEIVVTSQRLAVMLETDIAAEAELDEADRKSTRLNSSHVKI